MAFPIPLDDPVTTATFGSDPASYVQTRVSPMRHCLANVVGTASAAMRHETMHPEPRVWSDVHRVAMMHMCCVPMCGHRPRWEGHLRWLQ